MEVVRLHDELAQMQKLKLNGFCCSSIIIAMGLKLRGEENEQFVNAAKLLCHGMFSGLNCGALTGAVCTLGLFEDHDTEMAKDLVFWFQHELCAKYGSINCSDITGDNPYNKAVICPVLIRETYLHVKQLLAENGYIAGDDQE